MFLSDKNVQDCLRYKHGLITAEQLADLCNWPDVEYIRRWADGATFRARHYEAFAREQRDNNTAKAVSDDTQGYTESTAQMPTKQYRALRHGEFNN